MQGYLDDPSVLTKDKLKCELLANNVALPSGNQPKDVYVQLYIQNLSAQNKKHVADAFSSDEESPPPVVSGRRKTTTRRDKVLPDELDVTVLTDENLRAELLKHGLNVGPVVATTRKLYEKTLRELLHDDPAQQPQQQVVISEMQVNHNCRSEADTYSDKEDEVIIEPELEPVIEPEPEPEPVPVVERPARSRGKTPVTVCTRSSQQHMSLPEDQGSQCATKPSSPQVHPAMVDPVTFSPMCNISPIKIPRSHWTVSDQSATKSSSISARGEECGPSDVWMLERQQQKITGLISKHSYMSQDVLARQVEKIAADDQNIKADERDVLKELFPNNMNSPTGITATCRRPIRGAAGRPVKSSDLWNHGTSLFSPKAASSETSGCSSSYTDKVNRVTSLPSSTPVSSFTPSRFLSAAHPAGQTKAVCHRFTLWIKAFLLAIVAMFLFLVYQAMETNTDAPFGDSEVSSNSRG